MQLFTPITEEKSFFDKKLVFLAGPIQGAEEWQTKAIEELSDLDIYIANPRHEIRADFDYSHQVSWESKHLAFADVIMFWLPKESEHIEGRSYAQTTRFELAEWLAKINYNRDVTKVVVGVEDGFHGKKYIVERLKNTNVKVYDTFEDTLRRVKGLLQNGGKTFFTSDTHFGSLRALELSRRPFFNVKEMDAVMIGNWHRVVGENDTVYHLGDFGALEYAKYLPGKIHLILGNYEEKDLAKEPNHLASLQKSFKSVQKEAVIELNDGTKVHLSHKPSNCDMDMFNAFGHIHGRQTCKSFGLDVGVDCHSFTPVSEERLLFYKISIENYYDEEVFL